MFDEFNKAGRGGDNNMAAVDQIDLKPINVTGLDSSGGFKLDKSWGALIRGIGERKSRPNALATEACSSRQSVSRSAERPSTRRIEENSLPSYSRSCLNCLPSGACLEPVTVPTRSEYVWSGYCYRWDPSRLNDNYCRPPRHPPFSGRDSSVNTRLATGLDILAAPEPVKSVCRLHNTMES
ncbi:hypothetical protein RRG08_000054 [Elysia crispata]|uniref:Uncharacterized protein n=1 Tax=Elysia crispata TaxID=231223 RepID=A0AAE0Y6C7_9GAST|nr:hypothetical protein RRG08_000054 [Elysia crispata]